MRYYLRTPTCSFVRVFHIKEYERFVRALKLRPPWSVDRIERRHGSIHIYFKHAKRARWRCPECGEWCAIHDHSRWRQWRHADIDGLHVYVHAQVPRCNCTNDGILTVQLPWAPDPMARYTFGFEKDVLIQTFGLQPPEIAKQKGLRLAQVEAILERAHKAGRAIRVPDTFLDDLDFDFENPPRGQLHRIIAKPYHWDGGDVV